jgi:hypothetical protein
MRGEPAAGRQQEELAIRGLEEQRIVRVPYHLQAGSRHRHELRRPVGYDDLRRLGADEYRRRGRGPMDRWWYRPADSGEIRVRRNGGERRRQFRHRRIGPAVGGRAQPGSVVQQVPVPAVGEDVPVGVHREGQAGLANRGHHRLAVEHGQDGRTGAVEDRGRRVVDGDSVRLRRLLQTEQHGLQRHRAGMDAGQRGPDPLLEPRRLVGVQGREMRCDQVRIGQDDVVGGGVGMGRE